MLKVAALPVPSRVTAPPIVTSLLIPGATSATVPVVRSSQFAASPHVPAVPPIHEYESPLAIVVPHSREVTIG
jgi:hypothetical protein